MESVRLFFNIDSPLKSYNYTAFIGGTLFCKENSPALNYYMSNNILLLSNQLFDISIDDMVMFGDKSVFFCNPISKGITNDKELKEDIIKNICNGYYVSATVNEYFIPFRKAYQKSIFYHDILIYGYDLDENVFYTAAYDDSSYFTKRKYNIDIMLNSMLDCLEHRITKPHFHYFKPKGTKTIFNLDMVKKSIYNYLHCLPTKHKIYNGFYGFDAYSNLIKIINESVNNHTIIRKATFHMLWEHKKLMIDRFNYMKKMNIEFDESLIQEYRSVERYSKTVELLYLKYCITNECKLINSVIENIEMLSEIEYNVFGCLIYQI